MLWRDAVLNALRRSSTRHNRRLLTRQQLIDEELDAIVAETASHGATPWQTLSRVLQELRDEGVLHFVGEGHYLLLLDAPIDAELEDLPDEALDLAIEQGKLRLGLVPATDVAAVGRRRRGRERLRCLALANYDHCCAFCDVTEGDLLVASHISRWADDPHGRGDLANVLCACRFHDALFEYGYLSLSDDHGVLKKQAVPSRTVAGLLAGTTAFRLPQAHPPAPQYMRRHRLRTGFE